MTTAQELLDKLQELLIKYPEAKQMPVILQVLDENDNSHESESIVLEIYKGKVWI